MKVQRGLLLLDGTDLDKEAVLDIPVHTNKSFVISSVRAVPNLWKLPDNHYDEHDSWDNEALAYDGNITTRSQTEANDYLELIPDTLITCEKLRFMVRYVLADLNLDVPDIDIDVYSEEEWHNVFSGITDNDVWVEVDVLSDIENVRIKFNNSFSSGDIGYVSEVQLFDTTVFSLANTLCRVELTDVSGDNYTKIKATRLSGEEGHSTYVEWQVIYGDEFSVQSGVLDCNDESLYVSQAINQTDLEKSFIVYTNYTNDEKASKAFFINEFSSDEEIEFGRGEGESGDINSIRWYVIEWDGAVVKHYYAMLESDVVLVDIDEVDLDKAFLVSSYVEGENELEFVFSRSDIVSSGVASFTRSDTGDTQQISLFVIEHSDFDVKHNDVTISGLDSSIILDDLVSVSRSFTYTPQIGNAYTMAGYGTMFYGYNTHTLSQDGQDSVVTVERGSLGGELYASYFVVGYTTSLPTLTTQECTDTTYFSVKAHGTLINDGGFDVHRRGFCYIRSDSGEPTIDDFVVYEDGDFLEEAYSLDITGLNPSRTYRIKAYAVTLLGVGYGNTITITIDSAPMSEFCGQDVEDIGFVNKFKAPDY